MKRARLPLLCSAVLLVLVCLPSAAASAGDQPVTVRIEVGYSEGRLYYNKQIPVRVTLSDRSGTDLSGSVELFPLYDGTEAVVPAFVETGMPFSLEAGGEKELEIPVTGTGDHLAGIGCRVLDGRGCEIASCEERFDDGYRRTARKARLIGWLTNRQDDPFIFSLLDGELSYFVSGEPQTVSVEHISADRFPSDELLIDSFDVILVGDTDLSDSSIFSDRQRELLSFYLRAGGRIVVGTGARGAETLRGFSEFLSFDPSEACRYNGGTYSDSRKFPEGLAVSDLSEDHFRSNTYYGEGLLHWVSESTRLFVTPFSLADPAFEGSLEKQRYIMDMTDSADIAFLNRFSNIWSGSGGQVISGEYADAGFLVADVRDRSPSGIAMAAGIMIFSVCGIALPVVILKKRRREKLIPAVLCVSALVFSAVPVLIGVTVKGPDSVFTLNVVKASGPEIDHGVLLTGVYASGRGDRELSYLTPGVSVGIPKDNLADNGKLEVPDTLPSRISFSDSTSAVYRDVAKDSHIVDSARYFDTGYRGLTLSCAGSYDEWVRIVNGTGKDLSDAFLFGHGYYLYVGDLPAGVDVTVDTSSVFNAEISGRNAYLSSLTDSRAVEKETAGMMAESLAEAIASGFYRDGSAAEAKAEITDTIIGFRFGSNLRYKAYYFKSSSSAGGPFPSLRKKEDDFHRATVISCAGTLLDTSGSGMILGAFDGSAPDMTPLINGKKARSRYSLTLVYACLQTESSER